MATYQMRPMSIGEILDGSFNMLRQHFGLFFSLSVVCLGVPTAISFYINFAGGGVEHLGLQLFNTLLQALGYLLLSGASVWVVSEAYLGRAPTLGSALSFATGKMGAVFVSGLAAGIVTFLACLLLIIPGIIVACGYAVTVQAAVLEELASSTDALGRSWALTKGFKGKAFLLWLVMFVLLFVVFVGLAFMVGVATALLKVLVVPAMILFALIILMIYPFTSCVLTLFYYDLRVRKEAFDLELLDRKSVV